MDVLGLLKSALAGRYVVEREIGRGGMATVYLARDVRHDRAVALKVLSPELAAVVGTERFLSEIRVTAKLQHPHLLPLFDSGEAEGQLFYVMPYVEGESLRARINREKQLPIDEAVRIAAAVGGALDYAHRHGVIHRDLKPENILLQDAQPLVADFGIALAVSVAGGNRITQTGLSLGTPQYMSPEQATGDRVIDGRTDIYSLGAVLYEMLSGDPPHTGSTAQAVIAKVLTDKPRSLRLSRDTVPRHVEAAVECALAKLPADRFATAQEFVDTLRGTRPVALPGGVDTPASITTDPTVRARRRRQRWRAALPWAAAALGIAAALGVALWPKPVTRPIRMLLTMNDSARYVVRANVTIAISPDGERVAYAGGMDNIGQIFIRDLNDLDSRPVRGSDRGTAPVFSPDGRQLLFIIDGRLLRVPVEGGTPTVISDSATSAAWGDGDVIVFARSSGLFRTTSAGGQATRFTVLDSSSSFSALSYPHFLPGGQVLLLSFGRRERAGIGWLGAVRLDDGKVIDLNMQGTNPRYVAGGYVVFGRSEGVLHAARFDPKRLRILGPAIPVVDRVVIKGSGAADYGISRTGTLVYKTGSTMREALSVDLRGVATRAIPQTREFAFPRVSPDGRRIAFTISSDAMLGGDTWIYDAATQTLTRLTQGGGDRPEWSVDGKTVYTVRNDSGPGRFVAQRWDGSSPGTGRTIIAVPNKAVMSLSIPHSGHGYLAVRVGAPDRDIWIAPVDSPAAVRPFLVTPAEELMPSVSADGRWLAYVANESGRAEVYVRPLPGPGGRIQVSMDGGTEPQWSPIGRQIFYRGNGKVMLASITDLETSPSISRRVLFDDVYMSTPVHTNYAVENDGQHLLMLRGGEQRAVVVLNWVQELKQRVP